VKDLSPLAGKSFLKLDLDGLDIGNEELSIFKNAEICSLSLNETKITNLDFVKNISLKSKGAVLGTGENREGGGLYISNTQITDLSPLKGKYLRNLGISTTKVNDISVLEGMPLVSLYLDNNPQLTDLSPIKDCKTIEILSIPETAKDIGFLRKLPNLKRLDTKCLGSRPTDKEKMRTPEQFWKDYDAGKK
jgi:Leucine-rich repeat (LRR) protein